MTTNAPANVLSLKVGLVFIRENSPAKELISSIIAPERYLERKKQLPPILGEVFAHMLTTTLGCRFGLRFDEHCGGSLREYSPGFEILAEENELTRAIAEHAELYDRLVFHADKRRSGMWKIEGSYRKWQFMTALLVPLPLAMPSTPSQTGTVHSGC